MADILQSLNKLYTESGKKNRFIIELLFVAVILMIILLIYNAIFKVTDNVRGLAIAALFCGGLFHLLAEISGINKVYCDVCKK